jgi:peptidoglycan/LPS O-acetylase OafA/YrhL
VGTVAPEVPLPHQGLPHRRALDGLRGLAVAGVVIYHLDLGWLTGGFLGVSLFFTLSGFLITSLVLAERDHRGEFDARRFWGRRFRRLLPAAWAGIAVAIAFTWFAGDADQVRRLPGDVVAALAYVANWHYIISGDAYTAGYQAPSALLHYWSLAIEEQFYILFPFLVLALVVRKATTRTWLLVIGALTVGSMIATLVIYDPDRTTNVYFGTVTRAAELLAGVLLALVFTRWWKRPQVDPAASSSSSSSGVPGTIDTTDADGATDAVPHRTDPTEGGRLPAWLPTVVAVAALAATIGLWFVVRTTDDWLYRGGLWLVALVSVALIWAVLHDGLVAKALSWTPFVGLGLVSYGVYVYHWPLFLWISTEHTGLTGAPLVAARLGATAVLALLSYYLLELPIRRGRVHLTPLSLGGAALALVLLVVAALAVGRQADDRAIANATAARSGAELVTRTPVTAKPEATPAPPSSGTVPLAPPKKVLFLGDSIVHQAYPVIQARFAKEGIETKAIGGPGQTLLRHQAAWLTELQTTLAEYQPDVVVLESCCGFGDPRDPYLVDGKPVPPDTDAMWKVWQDTVDKAVTMSMADGRTVAWVLAPPASTNGYYGPIEGRIGRANDIAIAATERHPGLELVDWRVIAAPDGSYAEAIPDTAGNLVPVRAKDGLHFTPAGMSVLADVTFDAVLQDWRSHGGRRTGG